MLAYNFSIYSIPLANNISMFFHWAVSFYIISRLLKNKITHAEKAKDKKFRVGFFIHSLDIGGAERQLSQLARGLAQKGHEIRIYVYYGGRPLEKSVNHPNVKIISLKRTRRTDYFRIFLPLIFDVNRFQPDVFYSFLTVPNIYATIIKIIFPAIKLTWGIRLSDYDKVAPNLTHKVAFAMERQLSGIPDAIICNSRAGLSAITDKGYPKFKSLVIPNGIDTEKFKPDDKWRVSIRKNLSIIGEMPLIGMVARWDPVKDHCTFIRGLALLKKQGVQFKAICVGNGDSQYFDQLKRFAASEEISEDIFWEDKNNNPNPFYSAMDIQVSTSKSEGFSNVIGEAMACNLFQVVTDVGDSRLIVGNQGITIPPGSPEILCQTLARVINEKLYQTSNARDRVQKCFSLLQVTELTEAHFYRLTSHQEITADIADPTLQPV